MDTTQAVAALAALAQDTRLAAFRHLIAAAPASLPAGEVARLCAVPHNTMSAHLATLARAGLIAATRDGRAMLYRADIDGFRALVGFLADDCCAGRPEICGGALAPSISCCVPEDKSSHG